MSHGSLVRPPNLRASIASVVKALDLNLQGRRVVTEAATGPYSVTAVIAAMAGADVHAVARSSRFGTAEAAMAEVREAAAACATSPVQFGPLDDAVIASADIVTNSGHVRPLDEARLSKMKRGAVVPLMYEAWEFRSADIDLAACVRGGIRVAATNERHPDVDVFSYLGELAIKMLFDAGVYLRHNRLVLICNNDFGPYIARSLAPHCEALGIIDTAANRSHYEWSDRVVWLSEFPDVSIPASFADAAAVVFTANPFDQVWIGETAPISPDSLARQLNSPLVLRFCGDVDTAALDAHGIRYHPAEVASGHMGILLSAIGWDAIIRLQAGGLKAAELALRNETHFKGEPLSVIMC